MTHLSLFDPSTLLAKELRNALEATSLEFDSVSAFTSNDDDVDSLIDLAGAAARVELLTDASFSKTDLVVCASHSFRAAAAAIGIAAASKRPPAVLVMASDAPSDSGTALVEGVNLELATSSVMVSPTSSVVLTSQLAQALALLEPRSIDVTVLEAASTLGQDAMNEVFGQARSLLNFDGKMPKELLGRQIAFSSAPSSSGADRERQLQLQALLGEQVSVSLQTVQTGSFHGVALSGTARFSGAVESDRLATALEDLGPSWAVEALDNCESTIDRADTNVASIEVRRIADDQIWFWVAADNLVRGSARNAVSIVEAWTVAQRS